MKYQINPALRPLRFLGNAIYQILFARAMILWKNPILSADSAFSAVSAVKILIFSVIRISNFPIFFKNFHQVSYLILISVYQRKSAVKKVLVLIFSVSPCLRGGSCFCLWLRYALLLQFSWCTQISPFVTAFQFACIRG